MAANAYETNITPINARQLDVVDDPVDPRWEDPRWDPTGRELAGLRDIKAEQDREALRREINGDGAPQADVLSFPTEYEGDARHRKPKPVKVNAFKPYAETKPAQLGNVAAERMLLASARGARVDAQYDTEGYQLAQQAGIDSNLAAIADARARRHVIETAPVENQGYIDLTPQ